MFNLGMPELIVIGFAFLLLFGPKRLPELARGLGEAIRGFKEELSCERKPSKEEKSTATLPG